MHFLQLIALIGTLGPIAAQLELPDPRIVIVGPTGSGKSSLANALLGCDPRSNDCMFEVCPDLDSCTKETSIGTGLWLGTGQNFTVVDTPGFGDSDGEDNKLIEEMMLVLDDSLGYSNTILLLFDGTTARFTTGLHNMLRQMSSLFGEAWWNFMVIGVSKWKYSQAAIDERHDTCQHYPDQCKDEAWFRREINGQLQEKFHLDRNFSFAFIDSYAQSGSNIDDSTQQEHYQAEAKILWDSATTRNSTFDFKTIDDVLEENDFLKKENKRLNDIIETNITTLFAFVHKNEDRIDGNEERINSNEERSLGNKKNITSIEDKFDLNEKRIDSNEERSLGNKKNITSIEDKIDGNEKRIDSNEERSLGNKDKIDGNEKRIDSIEEKTNVMSEILDAVVTDVENLRATPLGTIIAWVNKPTTEAAEFADLPDGWVRCDGGTIPHPSIWAGQLTPDLNRGKRFLRGGSDEDMLKMEEDTTRIVNHKHVDGKHTHGATSSSDPHNHPYTDEYKELEHGNICEGRYWAFKHATYYKTTSSATVKVHTTIDSHTSNMGYVYNVEDFTDETRPKNMNVMYIMRVF